jgi:hypothetical protein
MALFNLKALLVSPDMTPYTAAVSGGPMSVTNLPAAALLADNAPLPTTTKIGAHLIIYDNTDTDMVRSVIAASGTTGIGLLGVGNLLHYVGTPSATGNAFLTQKCNVAGQAFSHLLITNGNTTAEVTNPSAASGTAGTQIVAVGALNRDNANNTWRPTACDASGNISVTNRDPHAIATFTTLVTGADNAFAQATVAGVAGQAHYITHIGVSFTAAATKRAVLKDGNTYVRNTTVYNFKEINFTKPLKMTVGNAVTLEVEPPGAGVASELFIAGYTTAP